VKLRGFLRFWVSKKSKQNIYKSAKRLYIMKSSRIKEPLPTREEIMRDFTASVDMLHENPGLASVQRFATESYAAWMSIASGYTALEQMGPETRDFRNRALQSQEQLLQIQNAYPEEQRPYIATVLENTRRRIHLAETAITAGGEGLAKEQSRICGFTYLP